MKQIPYKCPKCSTELVLDEGSVQRVFACVNGHVFDEAKEGYVNLHLVEKKKSKNPGDDAEMMKSRRTFLNSGYYQKLAEALVGYAKRVGLSEGSRLIDIGCGEGYYLECLSNAYDQLDAYGIDLSKHGARLAAKRKAGAVISVASAYDLPFFDGSFDVGLSVFSPISPEEVHRVLRPGGYLIMVGPGAGHLTQLAKLIYESNVPHRGNFDALNGSSNFSLVDASLLKLQENVRGCDLPNLLRMTPYYWKATPEQQSNIAALSGLLVDLEFEVKVFQAH